MEESRRVAVVGGTGCVGRQVCAAFAAHGDSVLAVARRPAGRPTGADFLAVDVAAADPVELAAALADRGVRVIVNAGGGWGTTDEEMDYSHVRLVDNLIRTVVAMPGPVRVVQVGSIHEYGSVPAGVSMDESLVPDPQTGYARTKLAGSAALLRAAAEGTVDAVVLRSVNASGPYPPMESFLGSLVARLRRARTAGDRVELAVAPARRDYVDVRDLADAVRRAADAPADQRVFNIGRGEAVPMGEVVGMLLASAALPDGQVRITETPVRSKGGDWTRADIRAAGRALAWRPTIALARSMDDMWRAAQTA